MITYRKANIEDIDTLAEMRISFLTDGKETTENEKLMLFSNNKQYFTNSMINDSFLSLVAIENNRIIATSGLTIYLLPPNHSCPNGKTAYISNMYTLPEYRGRGIATKLFSLIVEEAKIRGCEKITLIASDMGRPIYQKYGFEDSKASMMYYPHK